MHQLLYVQLFSNVAVSIMPHIPCVVSVLNQQDCTRICVMKIGLNWQSVLLNYIGKQVILSLHSILSAQAYTHTNHVSQCCILCSCIRICLSPPPPPQLFKLTCVVTCTHIYTLLCLCRRLTYSN
jgi:hypothetical protein